MEIKSTNASNAHKIQKNTNNFLNFLNNFAVTSNPTTYMQNNKTIKQTNKKLESLIKNGTILSYEINNISYYGKLNEYSESRNTEQLIIHFPNGESLTIDTFCSGAAEDTLIFIS
jgi:hypothetical protein